MWAGDCGRGYIHVNIGVGLMVKEHKLALLLAGVLFLLVYQYYAVVNPVTLRTGDDWKYFGNFFSHPVPRLDQWNITRLFPENMMPIAGNLSAFVVYPLAGDYLAAASITLAIIIALFITALFLSLYRLFSALCDNNHFALLIAMIVITLCFAIFKGNPKDNVHMFFTEQYNLYFFYVLPNILNSIVVLELMRQITLTNNLSLSSYTPPRKMKK
jgi:hypothetical protein